ncbi:MAG: Zn-dependent amino- or carboxypeptidase, M28 family [Chloroflexi bacterium]|nr:MAG: Zn-dependent amino- or carboxypeptidase, M28 family [Chloroflexota bacterium]
MATLILSSFVLRSAPVAGLGLALVALVLAACGGSDAASPAVAGSPATAESSEEAIVEQAAAPPEESAAGQAAPAASDAAQAGEQAGEQAPAQSESTESAAAEPPAAEEPPGDDPGVEAPSDPPALPSTPLPYDNDNALRILETLTVTIGPRVQGTEAERDAAAFLAAEFTSAGYVVELQPVPLESRRVAELAFNVDGETIDAQAFDGSGAGDVRGPLVVVPGLGAASDFAQVNVEGAVALIERGVLFFVDKIANAEAAGAAGVVIFNNEAGSFSGTLGEAAAIPALAITQEDGRALVAQAQEAALVADLLVRFDPLSGESQNVVARNPGGACTIWVGGHYDTVPNVPGANDNGSGTALVVELARAYAGSATAQQACFVAFGAEEAVGGSVGIEGSRVFVQGLIASGEINGVTAMLNLDVAAVGTDLFLIGDTDLVDETASIAEAIGVDASPGSLPAGSGSDHLNFAQAGVPVIFPTLDGGPIHDPSDNFSAVQPERVAAVGELAHALLGCLASSADAQAAPDCVLGAE